MHIEQIYTGCLAEASYYIESDGEAVIIDPLRETEPYLKKLEERGTKLKYIFETHFHADFVSGHVDLAKKTGAQIVYGPNAKTDFDAIHKQDGDLIKLGSIHFKILHTPGHTLESSCYLLIDESQNPIAIFTGDTLFIGDVGRPDLAIDNGLSSEDLAAMLFDSLRNKIMSLPDDVVVYPAHGAGSACGKNMSKETFDTLGHQKQVNYALRANMSKEDFVKEVLDGIPPAPKYFAFNARLNQQGYDLLDEIYDSGLRGHSVQEFIQLAEANKAIILDTRHQSEFVKGFIPGSIFIGIKGSFAPWVGTLLGDTDTPILYIADKGKEEEVVTRLSRVGFDNNLGYLKGGIQSWTASGRDLDLIESIDVDQFAQVYENSTEIVDVRKPSEFSSQSVEGAENVPLDYIMDNLEAFKSWEGKKYIHCAGGYRSVIFSSIAKRSGFDNLVDIKGGFGAISKHPDFKLTQELTCSNS